MIFSKNPRYIPQEETPGGTLNGVVTSSMQNMHGRNTMSLEEILTNEDILQNFKENIFPKVERTTSGWFFSPIKHSIFNMHQTYMKWFSITNEGIIPHDHTYDFAKLNLNGYLLKVSVPMLSSKISDFQVEYLVDTNAITPVINEIKDNSYKFDMPLFVLGKCPNVDKLLNDQQLFIQKYLSDVQAIIETK